MGKQKTKKTILGDSWLDPPKSEKNKKLKKNLGKKKKTILRDSWLDPLFLKTSPELFFFVFPRFFWFSDSSDFGGSKQESLRIVFVFFCVFSRFFGLASELTSHLKASVLFAYIRLKPSELNTSFVLVQISIYKSECINC